MLKPTGTQYLIFQAFDAVRIIKSDIFDPDTGIWHIWIFSPIVNIAKILPNGTVEPMEIEE